MSNRALSLHRDRAVATSLAREWREEAERRRVISKADPVPDVLEYCAGELAARVRTADSVEPIGVAEFARVHGVTEQTVRNWCRSGRLPAVDTPKGWAIPKDASPPTGRRSA